MIYLIFRPNSASVQPGKSVSLVESALYLDPQVAVSIQATSHRSDFYSASCANFPSENSGFLVVVQNRTQVLRSKDRRLDWLAGLGNLFRSLGRCPRNWTRDLYNASRHTLSAFSVGLGNPDGRRAVRVFALYHRPQEFATTQAPQRRFRHKSLSVDLRAAALQASD